jgi:FkbH-like protein
VTATAADTDAAAVLATLDTHPTLARTVNAVRQLERLADLEPQNFASRTVVVLRNFTIEPVEPQLKLAGFRAGLRLSVRYSGYQVGPGQELDELLADQPDAVLVALRLEELAPALSRDYLQTDRAHLLRLADIVVGQVLDVIRAVRGRSSAPIFVHTFVPPLVPSAGLSDSQDPLGQITLVRRMNVQLVEELDQIDGAYVLDVEHLFSSAGLERSTDVRGARLVDAPLSSLALTRLAELSVRHLQALSGPATKCVVVDCDGTLWGGTIGEDGLTGLVLGTEGPGRRYADLQHSLLNLRRRGIVLALCSKNEEADVRQVMSSHPDCVLGWNDFAAHRVNWEDKATNIVAMAEELNLSLEHMVFIDDDPWQCESVRSRLPNLGVLQWPDDFEGLTSLHQLGLFDALPATAEDSARTEMYQDEAQRRALRQEGVSSEEFLRSLDLVVTIGAAQTAHLPRLAQLTQRTNQFNLTTRRYGVSDLAHLTQAPGTSVLWAELSDRLGAYGLVGCAIVTLRGESAVIDAFLLSCRVLGRGVEDALANRIGRAAGELGATTLVGTYVPSERNAQVADLYPRLGFTEVESEGDTRHWQLPIQEGELAVPDWIGIVDADPDTERA